MESEYSENSKGYTNELEKVIKLTEKDLTYLTISSLLFFKQGYYNLFKATAKKISINASYLAQLYAQKVGFNGDSVEILKEYLRKAITLDENVQLDEKGFGIIKETYTRINLGSKWYIKPACRILKVPGSPRMDKYNLIFRKYSKDFKESGNHESAFEELLKVLKFC